MKKRSNNHMDVLICYTGHDENFLDLLSNRCLSELVQEKLIGTIFSVMIDEDDDQTRVSLENAFPSIQIVLILISQEFLSTSFVTSTRMKLLLEMHTLGEIRVIPVVLNPVIWKGSSLSRLQALPNGDRPITQWQDRSEALLDIKKGIELLCKEVQNKSVFQITHGTVQKPASSSTSSQQLPLQSDSLNNVFIKSGVPSVTFVERDDFRFLKLSLSHPSRSTIIEGPTGVGKTSSVKKAVENLVAQELLDAPTMLSARNKGDWDKLETLQEWHNGIVIIDDFHRLDPLLRNEIVDYMKLLADTDEPESKKLVIVGIPQTGQKLVDISFDIATRIDVFKFGQVSDELVIQMIEAGEMALNIKFDRKIAIALAAGGSLNIAQYLCYDICSHERIYDTRVQLRQVRCDIDKAISRVREDLSRRYDESIRRFVTLGGKKDLTCLKLLEELAYSEKGVLSLSSLKDTRRELASGIDRFIKNKWMKNLCNKYPNITYYLFFDDSSQELIVEDPQLTFYLSKMQFSLLAKSMGKVTEHTRKKVFISYSHKDAKWTERIRIHLSPIIQDGTIDLWDDTKIAGGAVWKQEIQNAIEEATVAVVVVSADFLASEFISEFELPKLLSRAEAGGTFILPIIVSPCLFYRSALYAFQAINPPDTPLSDMSESRQEHMLVNLTAQIRNRFSHRDNQMK